MLERDLQITLIKAIKSRFGEDVWIFKTHDQCRVGIPDLILCFYGHFVAIELKKPHPERKLRRAAREGEHNPEFTANQKDTNLTNMQKYNIAKINRAGGSAFPGRYFNEIMDRLERIFQSINNPDYTMGRGKR